MKTAKIESSDSLQSLNEFEVPNGWKLVTILDVCEVNPPKPPKDFLTADATVTFIPMPAVDAELGAITNPEIKPYLSVRNGFTSFRDGDVIMAKITPCMENGKAAIIKGMKNGIGFGSTEFHVMRSRGEILPEYLYYFIRRKSFRKEAKSHFTGSVGQKRVPADFIKQSVIPLPPLAEQQRIVARVEALLSRINAARDRLSRVPLIMKRFRQGVLSSACTGRLTEGWREENPTFKHEPCENEDMEIPDDWDIPEEWQWSTIGGVCGKIVDCPHSTPKWTQSGKICIRTCEIKPCYLDLSQTRYVSEDTYHERIQRLEPKEGDIVYSREGTLGQAAIIPPGLNICLGQRIMLLRTGSHCSPFFLIYLINSPQILKIVNNLTTGSTSPHINVGDVKKFPVSLPPLAEQHEIVRRVGLLFERADAFDLEVAAASRRCERLTEAVLGKAFRGELVGINGVSS
jgi:type I restriction enzyme S subunit